MKAVAVIFERDESCDFCIGDGHHHNASHAVNGVYGKIRMLSDVIGTSRQAE